MNKVEIKNLTVEYKTTKNKYFSMNDLNLIIEDGDFLVVVGPSGCGKTTLLNTILGLLDYSGDVLIDGICESRISLRERNFSYISQSYVLYPNMTVFENICFPLKISKTPFDEIRRRVTEVSKKLQIDFLLTRKPRQLSGGQQQRVALARAIIRNPSLYLFDEPFSNLEVSMRTELRHFLYKLHKELNATFVFVTHDLNEAMALASKLVVMNNGIIEQIGPPIEVYNNPTNDFVKGFMWQGKIDG